MEQDVKKIRQLAYDCLNEGKKNYWEGNTDDAMNLVEKSKNLFDGIDDKEGVAGALSLIAIILGAIGNESMAVDVHLQVIDIAKKYKFPIYEMIGYVNIGSAYQVVGANEKAIEYFKKAEDVLVTSHIVDDPQQQYRALGVYINLQDSYMALKQYDEAKRYIELAKPIAVNMSASEDVFFEFDVIECCLMWRMGEHEKVYKKLDKLMEYAQNYTVVGNYIQHFSNFCGLLRDMKEYDRWKQIIMIMESNTVKIDVLDVKLFINDMWLEWYKVMDDNEGYIKKCVEQIELYNQKKEENNRDKESAFDLRIEFKKNEAARKEAKKQSDTDLLTGTYNRRKLSEDIHKLTIGQTVCIGIYDIDCFKEKNDAYGHLSGDDCLKMVAAIIQEAVKKYDGRVYRFGGDEFVSVIKGCTDEQISEMAQKIKQKLCACAIPNKNSVVTDIVTLSQGYKNKTITEKYSVKNLMNDADKTLYQVKENGKNGFMV